MYDFLGIGLIGFGKGATEKEIYRDISLLRNDFQKFYDLAEISGEEGGKLQREPPSDARLRDVHDARVVVVVRFPVPRDHKSLSVLHDQKTDCDHGIFFRSDFG